MVVDWRMRVFFISLSLSLSFTATNLQLVEPSFNPSPFSYFCGYAATTANDFTFFFCLFACMDLLLNPLLWFCVLSRSSFSFPPFFPYTRFFIPVSLLFFFLPHSCSRSGRVCFLDTVIASYMLSPFYLYRHTIHALLPLI